MSDVVSWKSCLAYLGSCAVWWIRGLRIHVYIHPTQDHYTTILRNKVMKYLVR